MDDLRIMNQVKKDGWENVLTGLGTIADRQKRTTAKANGILGDSVLEALYADEGITSRIVDVVPDDMLRKGWKYDFVNAEKANLELSVIYNKCLADMDAIVQIDTALKWARLYGGSLLFLGALDGRTLDKPLNPSTIRTFETLRVLERSEVTYDNIIFQNDPTKPRFGKPEYYNVSFQVGGVSTGFTKIHYSRIIEFKGRKIPSGTTYTNAQKYWGISVLQNCYDTMKQIGSAFGSISNLFFEVSVGKYKLKDLADILQAPEGNKLLQNRLQSMDLMRSVFRSIYIDGEEEFTRETLSLGGVPEVMYQFFMVLSGQTGIPLTRLFGVSPGGLNSTGESDMLNYYDMVQAKQNTELRKPLERLLSIISQWKKIEPAILEFNPLQQLTEVQQADADKKIAETKKIVMETYQGWMDMQIMSPEVVEELEFGKTLQEINTQQMTLEEEVEEDDGITE